MLVDPVETYREGDDKETVEERNEPPARRFPRWTIVAVLFAWSLLGGIWYAFSLRKSLDKALQEGKNLEGRALAIQEERSRLQGERALLEERDVQKAGLIQSLRDDLEQVRQRSIGAVQRAAQLEKRNRELSLFLDEEKGKAVRSEVKVQDLKSQFNELQCLHEKAEKERKAAETELRGARAQLLLKAKEAKQASRLALDLKKEMDRILGRLGENVPKGNVVAVDFMERLLAVKMPNPLAAGSLLVVTDEKRDWVATAEVILMEGDTAVARVVRSPGEIAVLPGDPAVAYGEI